ncbi:MAG: polymer-forming cytoskeletal protein [Phycisphaerales bacterium]
MSTNNGDYTTTIGPDAKFKGDLEFESGARFMGKVEGNVKAKGKLLIAEGSQCKATVSAKEVTVEGILEGNVQAGDRIAVSPTGQVHGDIEAARMTMAEGATVNGFCRIGVKDGGGAKAAAETKPAAAKAAAAKG